MAIQAVGCPLHNLIVPPDQLEAARTALHQAIESDLHIYEAIRKRKDGSFVYVDVSHNTVRDAQGNIEFVITCEKDITRLKVLRDARVVEARFRGLLESVPGAIVMVNITGRIILVNSQAARMFRYERDELLGQPVEILLPLLPLRYHEGHVTFRTGSFLEPRTRSMGAGLELNGLRKDGREFPVEISLSPLTTEEGVLAMAAVRDITDRKQQEAEIHRKNRELGEQNMRVQEANRMKSEFLANMSHELRTPLNGIIGFTEFLVSEKPGPLNPKQRDYLTDVLNSGQHLLQLINDVLDVAKAEAGKMDLFPETFSLKKAVEEVCSVITSLAARKGIVVRLSLSPQVDLVTLDSQRFKQVLFNLLSNAVKFTDEGGEVEIITEPQDSAEILILVRDTGIGVKREDLPRLFTEFQQLDSSIARRYEGTGLGLALTKKIVELMGGSIRVESEVGQGTIFTVILPNLSQGEAKL